MEHPSNRKPVEWSEASETTGEEAEVLLCKEEGTQEPQINPMLTQTQEQDILELWEEFSDAMCDQPERTMLVENKIETGTAPTVRLPPYHLPHAYQDVVETTSPSHQTVSRRSLYWCRRRTAPSDSVLTIVDRIP